MRTGTEKWNLLRDIGYFYLFIFCITVNISYAQSTLPKEVIAISMGSVATPEYSGKWSYWNGRGGPDRIPHNPDSLLANGLADIMSAYHPIIGLYDLTDPDAVDYYYQSMKIVGIDAESTNLRLVSEWRIKSMHLRVAAMKKYDIKGIVRYEDKEHYWSDTGYKGEARELKVLEELSTWFDIFEPVQYKIDGRPVVMFFTTKAPDSLYAAWKNRFPINERPLLFSWANSLGSLADGDFEWIGAYPNQDPQPKELHQWSITDFEIIKNNRKMEVKRARERLRDGKISYHMDAASPGFNDTGSWGWGKGPRLVDRFDGKTYEWRWQQVITDGFDRVVLPTWDDWGEGSIIMPTEELGYREMETTRQYIAKYKDREPMTVDIRLPEWLYKVRKLAHKKGLQQALSDMDTASNQIALGNFPKAEILVKKWAKRWLDI